MGCGGRRLWQSRFRVNGGRFVGDVVLRWVDYICVKQAVMCLDVSSSDYVVSWNSANKLQL